MQAPGRDASNGDKAMMQQYNRTEHICDNVTDPPEPKVGIRENREENVRYVKYMKIVDIINS